jgi:hypothetical protein
MVADYLAESPLGQAMPELLRRMDPQSPIEKREMRARLEARKAAGVDGT